MGCHDIPWDPGVALQNVYRDLKGVPVGRPVESLGPHDTCYGMKIRSCDGGFLEQSEKVPGQI